MINFEKLKIALFDFDDTLAVHSIHVTESVEDRLQYNTLVLQKDLNAWSGCMPNDHLKSFILKCQKNGIRIGLISVTTSYPHMVMKQRWVEQNYGMVLENYCVCSAAEKVHMLEAISKAFRFNLNEILIVDDLWSTLESAADAGFQSASPIEVVNFINNDN